MYHVRWRSAAWPALIIALVTAPVLAAPPKTTTHVPKTTPGTTPNGNPSSTGGSTTGTTQGNKNPHTETALNLLHDAHRAVSGAHLPYNGHREKALKEINRAIRELAPPKPPTTTQTQTHVTPGHLMGQQTQTQNGQHGGQRPHTPMAQQSQADSDAKLKEALTLLNRAQGRITNNAQATEDVAAAIAELKAALGNQ